jgi:hypothetical protein
MENDPRQIVKRASARATGGRSFAELEEARAYDFLQIVDPWSYRCPQHAHTAYTLAGIVDALHRLDSASRTVLARGPPDLAAAYVDIATATRALHISTGHHFLACRPCDAFYDLYWGFRTWAEEYQAPIRQLLEQRFGLDAWAILLEAHRAPGYATFEDYIASRRWKQSR